jgi:amidase
MAAGLGPLELGSDIGGSIRIPSHCCGVFGHKPSWGIVPERGHIPGAPGSLHHRDINVNGPIARSAEDLELALGVLAGPDALEAAAWRLELPAPRRKSLRDFRIAAWLDDPWCVTERAQVNVFEAGLAKLEQAGAKVDAAARPPFTLEEAFHAYNPLLGAAIAPYSQATVDHKEWIAADEVRQQFRRKWAAFFESFDVLLAPAMFTTAFAHIERTDFEHGVIPVDGVDRPYRQVISWSGLAGASLLPATVMPVGRTPAGLPAGWQAIGPYLQDRTTIAFAALASPVLGGFQRPPGY